MMETFNMQKINQFAVKHGLQMVILFGSQARGEARAKSDTDIAVFENREQGQPPLFLKMYGVI